MNIKNKKVIVFDLDGTLSKSKLPINLNMAELLSHLTQIKKVGIIGGGKFALFKSQILAPMRKYRPNLENLYLFPTSGAACHFYKRGWKTAYELRFSNREVVIVKKAFKKALSGAGFIRPKHEYGILVENRGSEIAFSALGQRAPLSLKKKWNKHSDIRPQTMKMLKKLLSDFEIREGGLTSIDITRKGIDKGYAIRKIVNILKISKKDVLFIGDAIFPGGNDYAAKKMGVDCIKVSGPANTARILIKLL